MTVQKHELEISWCSNGMLEVPMLEAVSFTGRAPVPRRRPEV